MQIIVVNFSIDLFDKDTLAAGRGQLICYQVFKREDGTRFQKIFRQSQPTIEKQNQELFDIWNSF
jgi:hypothetical protein